MEIKNIDFTYNNNPFIVDLTAEIEKGKITTIIGPNGSGKSTLLSLLVKQNQPVAGTILLDGQSLNTMSTKELAKKMAIVYQQNQAPGDFTVERLVRFGRAPYQSFFKNTDDEEEEVVAWALKVTRLETMKDKKVSELSGGERQRAWIAMSLAQKTDILFLDEPTTYLDIYFQYEILSLVKELNEKYHMTIVMVLHDINQAIQFSDNIIIMKRGKIIYKGNVVDGITQQRLKEVYGITADIRWCEHNGCPYIVPLMERKHA